MNDHIPDPTKMINDTPRTDAVYFKQGATMYDLANEMKLVELELNAANDRIRLLIAERDTARQQSDQKVSLREEFRELLGTDDIEQGIAVVCDLKQLAAVRLGYIKQLKEQLMDAKNKHAVLVADVVLNEDRAERIKRLEETLDKTTKIASQRIKRLEDRIHRAAMAFFRDGSDGQVASDMLVILEEERGKP